MAKKRWWKKSKPEGQKYTFLMGTPPESLDPHELAALLALTAQLTELSNLPGYDPTDVTLTLTFGRTGHTGCAKLELPKKAGAP